MVRVELRVGGGVEKSSLGRDDTSSAHLKGAVYAMQR